ncbi:MAG: hypothetical protein Greene041662_911 [Candidatus Peregrinibacteria bacterium Greene0416_62]|nr:MAG: hypothetical protein Greene041662_911 [Candidatus Peregrinibacteria bacterium Greene0416_62]TSC98144.1 MAG: hypothetical protein Greene101449_1000 [Candidatus Peregrinibacteria bacterium Greene1014_49]
MKKSGSFAGMIGSGFAHLQHAIDEIADAGFRTLKKVGTEPKEFPKTPKGGSWMQKAKAMGKGTLRFLGEAGESYYRKYDELKVKKK